MLFFTAKGRLGTKNFGTLVTVLQPNTAHNVKGKVQSLDFYLQQTMTRYSNSSNPVGVVSEKQGAENEEIECFVAEKYLN